MPEGAPRVQLTGWGRTAPTPAVLTPVSGEDDVRRVLLARTARGVVARGLGRSYGDAAQNAGGAVLDMTTADRVLDVDPAAGAVEVEAGISLDALMSRFVPMGLFVPVTAGTRYVTVGRRHVEDGATRVLRGVAVAAAEATGHDAPRRPGGEDAPDVVLPADRGQDRRGGRRAPPAGELHPGGALRHRRRPRRR